MSVTALVGWGKGCDPYIKPETMMYYRPIIDGMPASYPDGKEACPASYFGTANYEYLKSLHTKSMSSTRGEFSGTKGIRGIFSEKELYRPENAETEEDVKACEEKAKELLKVSAQASRYDEGMTPGHVPFRCSLRRSTQL
jgi:hypothetical protein